MKNISYYDYSVRIKKKMEVASYVQESLAAALTATMVGSMFSTVAGAEEAKNIPTLTTDPLEITLWDISTEDPGKTICEDAVARFMADYPNITVNEVHQQNDNYKQQLVVAMSSKQAPDMYIHWGRRARWQSITSPDL